MPSAPKADIFRKLPGIDELLREAQVARAIAREGRVAVTAAARTVLDRLRTEIAAGHLDPPDVETRLAQLPDAIERELQRSLAHSLRPVINATGVILHTNLGRAPLAESALAQIAHAAAGYSNLEFDLDSGERGERDVHVDRLFRQLFRDQAEPACSTIVVNNNAAAVWLALNTLAAGGEVVVSRGELVEIGGSFRIPDVMQQSNGILREVGTTNRTRISDYEKAINDKTRALLRVHRSNFQITGFTEQAALEDLVSLARARNIPLIEDLGSGAIFDLRAAGIAGENGVAESVRAGVDVVTYSGDKLLGGPQAGLLTGRADLIRRTRSNSLFRALRVDKLTYAALEATLLAYVKGKQDEIPAIRMMRLSKDSIGARAEAAARQLRSAPQIEATLIDGESVIGGGAAPSATLPTRLLAITIKGLSADQLLTGLRALELPIIARVQEGRVVFDLRTVLPEQDGCIASALSAIASSAVAERLGEARP
jgi:L-seryl-tRNA(Ser) seleniumtransferase